MSAVNDLISVEEFVRGVSPTSATEKQTVPKKPTANLFVIRQQDERRTSETRFHFRIDREYQLVYYGTDAADTLAKMDALSTALYKTELIPIKDSLRYLRVESFSISAPFRTDNELDAIIAVLAVTVREARDQETYDKIARVYTRFQLGGN